MKRSQTTRGSDGVVPASPSPGSSAVARADERSPLPEHLHPHIRVAPATVDRWKRQAEMTIEQELHDNRSWYYDFDRYVQQDGYKLILDEQWGTRGGGRVLPRTLDDSSNVEFVWHAQLQLHLDDVVLAMHCESTAQQRVVFTQLFPNAVLDGGILQLFEGATESDPFRCVSIKWIVFTTPVRNLVSYRDYLYFEYCCSTVDTLGRRVLVEYKLSIDTTEAEQFFDHTLDVKRASIFMLNTYRVEGDCVVNAMLGTLAAGGSIPSWAALKYLPVVFGRVKNTEGLAQTMALIRAGVRASTLLAARNQSTASVCSVCAKRFGLTQRKTWCRLCGLVVCRPCARKVLLPKEGLQIATHLPFVCKQFCLRCMAMAWQVPLGQAAPGSGGSYRLRSVRLTEQSGDGRADSFFGCSREDSDELDGMLDDATDAAVEQLFQEMRVTTEPKPTR